MAGQSFGNQTAGKLPSKGKRPTVQTWALNDKGGSIVETALNLEENKEPERMAQASTWKWSKELLFPEVQDSGPGAQGVQHWAEQPGSLRENNKKHQKEIF